MEKSVQHYDKNSPRYKAMKRMFAVAMKHEPHNLYYRLPKVARGSILANTVVNFLEPDLPPNSGPIVPFMTAGIHDVTRALTVAFDHDGDVDQELAYDVIQAPETTETIAELSSRYQTKMRQLINIDEPGNNFFIDRDTRALVRGNRLPSSHIYPDGCPAAGKLGLGERAEVDPVFKRFIPWAGTLAVRYYFDPAYK